MQCAETHCYKHSSHTHGLMGTKQMVREIEESYLSNGQSALQWSTDKSSSICRMIGMHCNTK